MSDYVTSLEATVRQLKLDRDQHEVRIAYLESKLYRYIKYAATGDAWAKGQAFYKGQLDQALKTAARIAPFSRVLPFKWSTPKTVRRDTRVCVLEFRLPFKLEGRRTFISPNVTYSFYFKGTVGKSKSNTTEELFCEIYSNKHKVVFSVPLGSFSVPEYDPEAEDGNGKPNVNTAPMMYVPLLITETDIWTFSMEADLYGATSSFTRTIAHPFVTVGTGTIPPGCYLYAPVARTPRSTSFAAIRDIVMYKNYILMALNAIDQNITDTAVFQAALPWARAIITGAAAIRRIEASMPKTVTFTSTGSLEGFTNQIRHLCDFNISPALVVPYGFTNCSTTHGAHTTYQNSGMDNENNDHTTWGYNPQWIASGDNYGVSTSLKVSNLGRESGITTGSSTSTNVLTGATKVTALRCWLSPYYSRTSPFSAPANFSPIIASHNLAVQEVYRPYLNYLASFYRRVPNEVATEYAVERVWVNTPVDRILGAKSCDAKMTFSMNVEIDAQEVDSASDLPGRLTFRDRVTGNYSTVNVTWVFFREIINGMTRKSFRTSFLVTLNATLFISPTVITRAIIPKESCTYMYSAKDGSWVMTANVPEANKPGPWDWSNTVPLKKYTVLSNWITTKSYANGKRVWVDQYEVQPGLPSNTTIEVGRPFTATEYNGAQSGSSTMQWAQTYSQDGRLLFDSHTNKDDICEVLRFLPFPSGSAGKPMFGTQLGDGTIKTTIPNVFGKSANVTYDSPHRDNPIEAYSEDYPLTIHIAQDLPFDKITAIIDQSTVTLAPEVDVDLDSVSNIALDALQITELLVRYTTEIATLLGDLTKRVARLEETVSAILDMLNQDENFPMMLRMFSEVISKSFPMLGATLNITAGILAAHNAIQDGDYMSAGIEFAMLAFFRLPKFKGTNTTYVDRLTKKFGRTGFYSVADMSKPGPTAAPERYREFSSFRSSRSSKRKSIASNFSNISTGSTLTPPGSAQSTMNNRPTYEFGNNPQFAHPTEENLEHFEMSFSNNLYERTVMARGKDTGIIYGTKSFFKMQINQGEQWHAATGSVFSVIHTITDYTFQFGPEIQSPTVTITNRRYYRLKEITPAQASFIPITKAQLGEIVDEDVDAWLDGVDSDPEEETKFPIDTMSFMAIMASNTDADGFISDMEYMMSPDASVTTSDHFQGTLNSWVSSNFKLVYLV